MYVNDDWNWIVGLKTNFESIEIVDYDKYGGYI